jgi:dolichol-phosphate mannosyltransferase
LHGGIGSTFVTTTEEKPAQSIHVSVVVPTYQEVENIPLLVERLEAVRKAQGWQLELWLMDDDSRDGSAELVAKLGLPWVQLITRTSERGLSQAVLDGLRRARGDVLVVMDADLSHPPETLPALLAQLDDGAEMVVGSRFVDGGTTDDDWGAFRWLNSRIATLLAFPLTRIDDPMSGFFMLRRQTFESHGGYTPIGYKIGLELLVKCECRDVREVPIHFVDRRLGHSKLSLREQLRYLMHVRRLYTHKFALWSQLTHFLLVGASGLVVNLAVLTALLAFGSAMQGAVIGAIALSMVWNFGLNRTFSFAGASKEPFFRQLFDFVSACAIGAVVNYSVTLYAVRWFGHPQLSATIGVLAATGFNFTASRLYVFKRRHVRKS